MKAALILAACLGAQTALAAETTVPVDSLEDGPGAWSVEGEQHASIETTSDAFAGRQALAVHLRRAQDTWSNEQLKLTCPPDATALRFQAKAVDRDLTIHPQFRAAADWQNWALWLDQPLELRAGIWSLCEIRLDRCRNLFSRGEISTDILAERGRIDSFLISANQDAEEGSFIIDDLQWVKEP